MMRARQQKVKHILVLFAGAGHRPGLMEVPQPPLSTNTGHGCDCALAAVPIPPARRTVFTALMMLSTMPVGVELLSSPIPHNVAIQRQGLFNGLHEDRQSPHVIGRFRTLTSGRQPASRIS